MKVNGTVDRSGSNVLFEVHDTDEDDGFRDTHQTEHVYEDHLENKVNNGTTLDVHTDSSDGTRVNIEGHEYVATKVQTDVKDINGITDTDQHDSQDEDKIFQFHEHHGGTSLDADSSFTKHSTDFRDHQKEEHRGKGAFTLLEESDSRNTESVNVKGDNLWQDFQEEQSKWPKNMTNIVDDLLSRRSLVDASSSYVKAVGHRVLSVAPDGMNKGDYIFESSMLGVCFAMLCVFASMCIKLKRAVERSRRASLQRVCKESV